MSNALDIARASWGDEMPDWVERLANECVASSQNKVATKLNRSASLISAVLRNKYRGDMSAVEEVVRGVFERAVVQCPTLGTIPSNICRDWQLKARSYSNVNSQRVRMFRACNRCPRHQKEPENG